MNDSQLTMDTKWMPAMPLPSFKQWVGRSRELSGFRDWAEKLGGWLALRHDQHGPELREALAWKSLCLARSRPEAQGKATIASGSAGLHRMQG